MKTITEKISIKCFNPLKATQQEWHKYHEFRRKKQLEENPDDPISSNESAEKAIKLVYQQPEAEIQTYNIYDLATNKQIGDFMCAIITEESPSYEGTKHLVQFDIYILKPHRRKGIARKALKIIHDFAVEKGKTLLVTGSSSPDGNAFLRKLGAQIALSGVENRLYLDKVDWKMIRSWTKEGQKRSPDTRLEIYSSIPTEVIEQYCKVYTEVLNQQPLGDLDVGAMVITPEVYRQQESMFKEMGRDWITVVAVEPSGTISGLTEMRYNPNRKTMISQLLTGVQQDCRGRGIGKWLKAEMLLKVQKDYPLVTTVTTGNATTNAPMLSINKRLGFKKHKESISAQLEVSKLGQHLASA